MIVVSDIEYEVKRVLGTCSDEQVYKRLNEVINLLKNTGLWDPLVGFMDICTQECSVTLPDDVEIPLAINVGGTPADFRNKWYEFHLNGPGSQCCSDTANFSWGDQGMFPTFRDPILPVGLAATSTLAEASTAVLRVFGYDSSNTWIMTADATGTLVDGFDVPIILAGSSGAGVPTTQQIKRITRIIKPLTRGFVNLYAYDGTNSPVLYGKYRPYTTEPSFRRITISGAWSNRLCSCPSINSWIRMRFRKKTDKVNSMDDAIPLNSDTAIKMGIMAIKKYEDDLPEQYDKYLAMATDALRRDQKARNGPNQIKIQFQRGGYGSKIGENMI